MKHNSHKKFHTLLQFAADQPLRRDEQTLLDRHLAECSECRQYAHNLDLVEDGLRRVMQQQWNVRPQSLSVAAIQNRSGQMVLPRRSVAAFGKFAFIPMLALTIFMVLTVRMTNPQKASQNLGIPVSGTPSMAMIIPKPPASASVAASRTNTQACKQVTYTAQANETIDGIAIKYGVSKEAIATANNLSTDKLDAPQTLIIPLCQNTPVETPTVPNTLTLPSDNPSPRG